MLPTEIGDFIERHLKAPYVLDFAFNNGRVAQIQHPRKGIPLRPREVVSFQLSDDGKIMGWQEDLRGSVMAIGAPRNKTRGSEGP